jgi:hypothetical protein
MWAIDITGYTWVKDTGRFVCDGCDRWIEMEMWVDSREVRKKQVEGGTLMVMDGGPGPDADPPRRPPIYKCRECGHEHEGQPSLQNPT